MNEVNYESAGGEDVFQWNLYRGVAGKGLLQRLCAALQLTGKQTRHSRVENLLYTSQGCGSRTHEFLFKYSRMHDILSRHGALLRGAPAPIWLACRTSSTKLVYDFLLAGANDDRNDM